MRTDGSNAQQEREAGLPIRHNDEIRCLPEMRSRTVSKTSTWLGRGSAPVDQETWCYVPAGDPLLTRRASDCDGRDLMQTTTWSPRGSGGKRTVSSRVGRFVRHEEIATVLGAGGPTAVRRVAERALGRIAPSHIAGITLCADVRLAAPLLSRLTHLSIHDWVHGTHDALATGASRVSLVPRMTLALGLRKPITETEAAWWLHLHDAEPGHTAMYAAAGLSIVEAQEQERLGTYDFDVLATLTVLRNAGESA